VIDRVVIYGDSTWSVGEVGATITAAITAESLRADARTGSEADSISIQLPDSVTSHFHAPPIGRSCDVIYNAATLASGVITEVYINTDGVRMRVDL
jgi:hypothetical protein